jgi:hypothetical protein
MTQPGETDGFQLSDHVRALRRHVGENFPDWVISHRGALPRKVLEKYAAEGAKPVADDLEGKPEFASVRVISGDFFHGQGSSDGMARHDSQTLARAIHEAFLAPLVAGRAPGGDAPLSRPRRGAGVPAGSREGTDGAAVARPRQGSAGLEPAVTPPRQAHGTRTLD